MTTLANGLQQVPFLQPLTDDQVALVVERGNRLVVPAGEVLFRKGDFGHCMYVILSGKVQIYLDAGEGQVLVLGVLAPGDFFGEMALIDGGPRSAGALTVGECELFVLERAAFLDLLSVSPELLSRLFAGLTERLRATDERYLQEEIAKQTVRADMERARHRSLAHRSDRHPVSSNASTECRRQSGAGLGRVAENRMNHRGQSPRCSQRETSPAASACPDRE